MMVLELLEEALDGKHHPTLLLVLSADRSKVIHFC